MTICRWGAAAIVLTCLAASGAFFVLHREEQYQQFVRPDGHYRLIVYRSPRLFGMMPGQASDAAGRIEVVNATGRRLYERTIEPVQLADHVVWEARSVSIPAVGVWQLPD